MTSGQTMHLYVQEIVHNSSYELTQMEVTETQFW